MYKPANIKDWNGEQLLKQGRLIDYVLLADIKNEELLKTNKSPVILGFESDEGVKRSYGRIGAKAGPTHIRNSLGKLYFHKKNRFVFDAGNIECENDKLEAAQNEFGENINNLINSGYIPIGLGGGHEIAFASYIGIREHINKKSLGIINFDAHFDMRNTDINGPSSSTSFYQIAQHCERNKLDFNYLCLGIQKFSNSDELFNTAKNYDTQWEYGSEISLHRIQRTQNILDEFLKKVDYIYLSICMDVFHASYAPGVSAINPLGLNPEITIELINYILASNKTICIDIAEVNPKFDIDNRTAKLASALISNIFNVLEY